MSVLSEREAYILNRYFGLDGEPPVSLEEISGFVGVTRERTRQLRNQALNTIRDHVGDALEDYLEPTTAFTPVGVRRDASTTGG
jgi:DNA-directed RNA polymerase sigma subunit (sigma70/sigma32)